MTDAECSDPPGPIGPICGGKRCLGGANAGAACTVNSECPGGGLCGVPGETQPNACAEDTSTPLSGCLPAGGNEGICADGPMDKSCAPPEQYQSCFGAGDCPITASCIAKTRECFPDNGVVGGSITAQGAIDPPLDASSAPTLGSVSCAPASAASVVNIAFGFPRPGTRDLEGDRAGHSVATPRQPSPRRLVIQPARS